jgi:hypothetical protein
MENNHSKGGLQQITVVSAVLMLTVAFIICLFQAYVRWFLNQEYTVLGGWTLEALTISSTALLVALSLKK